MCIFLSADTATSAHSLGPRPPDNSRSSTPLGKKLPPGGYSTNTRFRRGISLGEISTRGIPLGGILTHNTFIHSFTQDLHGQTGTDQAHERKDPAAHKTTQTHSRHTQSHATPTEQGRRGQARQTHEVFRTRPTHRASKRAHVSTTDHQRRIFLANRRATPTRDGQNGHNINYDHPRPRARLLYHENIVVGM